MFKHLPGTRIDTPSHEDLTLSHGEPRNHKISSCHLSEHQPRQHVRERDPSGRMPSLLICQGIRHDGHAVRRDYETAAGSQDKYCQNDGEVIINAIQFSISCIAPETEKREIRIRPMSVFLQVLIHCQARPPRLVDVLVQHCLWT